MAGVAFIIGMLARASRRFSFLHNLFGLMDTSSSTYRIGTFPVDQPLPEDAHKGLEAPQQMGRVQVTTLSNGVRVLTESETVPGLVNLGILLDCGSRDEQLTEHTDGMCFALKNTFMKSNTRTNEQLNYCMVQMSGGEFTYEYDQEKTYLKANCLAHDTYDFVQMMADCLLDDKTVIDEEAAQWRADEYWKLRDFSGTPDEKVSSLWHSTAYGLKGLGMPVSGFPGSFHRIGYSHMNEFRRREIVPSGIIVAAAGIKHHEEFVETVKPYYEHLEARTKSKRQSTPYLGGQHREICDSDTTYVNLSFESVPWTSPDLATAMVLKTLIGDGGGFSTGGPGKGMHSRAYTQILNRFYFINSVKSENVSFSDSGHFRILAVGPSAENEMIGYALVQVFLDLTNVSDTEVTRAKNCLKNQVCQTLEKASSRLEDTAKMLLTFNQTPQQLDYLKLINSVSTEAVRKFVRKLLSSKPTVVAVGGDTHNVPSADRIEEIIRAKLG